MRDDITILIELVACTYPQTSEEGDKTGSFIVLDLRQIFALDLLQKLLDCRMHLVAGEMQQREKSGAYAVCRIGLQASLISDTLELGLKIILIIFYCHIVFFVCKDITSMKSIKIRTIGCVMHRFHGRFLSGLMPSDHSNCCRRSQLHAR